MPPRYGGLTREVLAINMVMAGCKPDYAPVVRAAMLALTANAFNLNGVQATTHMAGPLLVVNGPIAREIGMNGGVNAFGSGNRANATIGRAIRLILLNVGGGTPGDLDKSTLGHPGKYTYCVAENEAESPFAPYHVEKGFAPEDSTVFVIAAEPPHSCTNHVADDPEGILDTICSAMSTIANNNAVSSGHCAVVIGPEHARTIAAKGWTRHDIRNYSAPAFGQPVWRSRLQPPLRQDLQPQPAALVQARPRSAHPDRAQSRPHPSVRDRRHRRAVLGLHPWLGTYVVAGAARDRGRRPVRSSLRRRHVLSLSPSWPGAARPSPWIPGTSPGMTKEGGLLDGRRITRLRSARAGRCRAGGPGAAAAALKGLRLGILDNTKWNANRLLRKTAALLEAEHGIGAVSYYKKESFSKVAEPALIAEIAANNDIVLTAIGD